MNRLRQDSEKEALYFYLKAFLSPQKIGFNSSTTEESI